MNNNQLRAVCNDGSWDRRCQIMLKGRGLSFGITEEEARRLMDQLAVKLHVLDARRKK